MDVSVISLHKIKWLLDHGTLDEKMVEALARDPRSGARALYRLHIQRLAKSGQERARMKGLFSAECAMAREGFARVAGVDEVGRGPLAGPVVAAAVMLPFPVVIPGLNDSKRLAPRKREQVAHDIVSKALAWGVGVATVEEIDQTNILRASLLAMRRAVTVMNAEPDGLLVDGQQCIPGLSCRQRALIGGDARSASVAAASVVAKVFRDALMCRLDIQYPQYGFARHKGYGTRAHYQALARWGPSPLHRRAFLHAPTLFTD